jgi:hypothetical protein
VSRGRGGVEQVELGVGTDRHLVVGEDVYRCQAIREGTTPSPPARGMRVNPGHVAMFKKFFDHVVGVVKICTVVGILFLRKKQTDSL